MSTLVIADAQSLAETRTHFGTFREDLPEGVTVVSVSATHIPPAGGTLGTVVLKTTTYPAVAIQLSGLRETGLHYVSCLAALSNGDIVELRFQIKVEF